MDRRISYSIVHIRVVRGQAIIYAQNISTNNQESDRKKIKYNSPQKKLYLKNNLKKRKSSIIASIIK